ncbi:FG-GAP repeat protein [Streptomyces meridianus]|uniref:FG-GAP repeat protein n=1 Tax=Streptomyces meridianus TaxID=2938945 RepID=A0ABT0XCN6_9ACTN|nr:FG-GAP repeat protein [Streptomyces meridianus]MCM2580287.1 FG-GAP repeat protein [Streptomyces meridianus]
MPRDQDGKLITYGSGPSGAGSIAVRYGGPGGVPGSARSARIDQDTTGVPGVGESGDAFGADVSIGDVTGDGYPDVAVGAPDEDLGARDHAGAVRLLKGSASGLTGAGAQSFTQDTSGVPGKAESGDRFGYAVRLEDMGGDGHADLAAAASGEDVFDDGSHCADGSAWVLEGSGPGLATSGAVAFSEKAFGLTYRNKSFGSVLGGWHRGRHDRPRAPARSATSLRAGGSSDRSPVRPRTRTPCEKNPAPPSGVLRFPEPAAIPSPPGTEVPVRGNGHAGELVRHAIRRGAILEPVCLHHRPPRSPLCRSGCPS